MSCLLYGLIAVVISFGLGIFLGLGMGKEPLSPEAEQDGAHIGKETHIAKIVDSHMRDDMETVIGLHGEVE